MYFSLRRTKKKLFVGNVCSAAIKAFSPSEVFGAARATDLFRDKERIQPRTDTKKHEGNFRRIFVFCACLFVAKKFMAIRKITEYPEKVLAEIGKPVTVFDEELENLCADMFETMYEAEGVGLAAQQIGLPMQLFVMDCEGVKLVAANPEIIATTGEQSNPEGCLSIGKVPAIVVRAERATLRAQDAKGEWFEQTAEGYAARCFQHETDHCNGKLFIDRLPKMRRDMVVKRFRKEKNWK
jgi:peptide deformylase